VLFENPLGINDVGLDGILADLEGLDYEVAPPLIIPACAVNSPQLRNRYWIVGYSKSSADEQIREVCQGERANTGRGIGNLAHATGRQDNGRRNGDLAEAEGCGRSIDTADRVAGQSDLADLPKQGLEDVSRTGIQSESTGFTNSIRLSGILRSKEGDMADTDATGPTRFGSELCKGQGETGEIRSGIERFGESTDFWSNSVWLPCADGKVRRAPDDSFGVAHGLHRSVLAGLGNSIVPQVASEIIRAIVNSLPAEAVRR